MIGKTLAHYHIVDKIGQGGMGEVFRARDTRLDRDVALKILPQEIPHSAERTRRFEQEAKAIAALSHPNILSIYDFGSEGDQFFAIMELLEGETLGERLARGPIPPRKTIELASQIAAGLAAAHSQGVIHRDLKPENIFITTDGQAKILDFGLARNEREMASTTQSPTVRTDPGTVMGTVGYMSPEQARGATVDTRSDIFSAGAVFYEMLTGKRAFDGDSYADVIGSVLRDDPRSMRETDPSIPEGLERVVQHCMEKSADQRFQSARDLGFALNNVGSTSQTMVTLDELPAARNNSRRVLLPVVAILGWIVAAIILIQPGFRSSEPGTPARLKSLTYSGRDWAPTTSPDGAMVAFVSDRDGISKIWLKQVAGGGEAALTTGSDDNPRFSPDGSQILFVREEEGGRYIYRTSMVGSQTRKLLDDAIEADWSPDGNQIAFVRMLTNEGLNRVLIGVADVQSGAERILTQVDNRGCYGIRWSPTGQTIAVSEGPLTGNVSSQTSIALIDVASGEVRRSNPTGWGGPFTAVQWSPSGKKLLVGQSREVLARATGEPGQLMEIDVEKGTTEPLIWAMIRLPTSGWAFSALGVIPGERIVLDEAITHAELRQVDWGQPQNLFPARVVTRGLGIDRQPSYSPDGRKVIFSSNRSGNVDLWVVGETQEAIHQLTDDPADDWDPAFTPDGQHILWSSNRGGNMEIWMAGVDGAGATQVSRDGEDAENPTMTADGEWIVYASGNDDKVGLWKIRPDGSDATRLTAGSLLLPEVSPDGRYALFLELRGFNSVIQVVEISTGKVMPFAIELTLSWRHQNVVVGRARWSPDGSMIVYIGENEHARTGVFGQKFVPGEDTSDTRVPLAGFSKDFSTESLSVSPDGKHLTISAVFEQRSIKIADHVALTGWE